MPFRDVPAGAYYAQPVLWAYHAGVVNGCGADTFCPTQAISRQDLTVILYRYACLTGIADAAQSENVLSGFADAGAVSDYARAALAWAVENGIVYGRNDHRIDPLGRVRGAPVALCQPVFSRLTPRCPVRVASPIPVTAGPPRSVRSGAVFQLQSS